MQIRKYPSNVLLHQPEYSADVHAGAKEETVHETEGKHCAGSGSGQKDIGEGKQRWLDGKGWQAYWRRKRRQ